MWKWKWEWDCTFPVNDRNVPHVAPSFAGRSGRYANLEGDGLARRFLLIDMPCTV